MYHIDDTDHAAWISGFGMYAGKLVAVANRFPAPISPQDDRNPGQAMFAPDEAAVAEWHSDRPAYAAKAGRWHIVCKSKVTLLPENEWPSV